jgi:hypothetical protein
MSKRITVRWYTGSMIYKGWEYIDKVRFSSVWHWLRSGNCVKMGDEILDNSTSNTKLLNLFKIKEYSPK